MQMAEGMQWRIGEIVMAKFGENRKLDIDTELNTSGR